MQPCSMVKIDHRYMLYIGEMALSEWRMIDVWNVSNVETVAAYYSPRVDNTDSLRAQKQWYCKGNNGKQWYNGTLNGTDY